MISPKCLGLKRASLAKTVLDPVPCTYVPPVWDPGRQLAINILGRVAALGAAPP